MKKYGRIINIVSLSGLKGLPGQTNYAASKGGIISATKALAQEVGRRGITVNAIAPGFITTDMTENISEKEMKSMIPVNRFGRPEEVAHAVAFLASPESGYITGEVLSINGGMYS
jgi:3-oxoacyl-[acyl-carrier protein] reductase